MIKKLVICALALVVILCIAGAAWAEELPLAVQAMVPAGAVVEKTESAGTLGMLTISIPDTGERLIVTYNAGDGSVLFVETETEANCRADAAPVERSRAEEIVRREYPDCRILFAEDADSGKRLGVVGENFCGSIVVVDERIRSRSLQVQEMYLDGVLSMSGALQVMKLHRPEAEFRALELDEDDGVLIYEGEALLSGEVYEFELDVSTGKLLEWERD